MKINYKSKIKYDSEKALYENGKVVIRYVRFSNKVFNSLLMVRIIKSLLN